MGRKVIDWIGEHLKNGFGLAMIGMGVTAYPHEWIAGMFFSAAAAAWAMKMEPETDKVELWTVWGGAFITTHLAYLTFNFWWPEFPILIPMIVAGFASRKMARATLKAFGRVEDRSGDVVDMAIHIVVPHDKDKKDAEK